MGGLDGDLVLQVGGGEHLIQRELLVMQAGGDATTGSSRGL
jgi:hypothetical protein